MTLRTLMVMTTHMPASGHRLSPELALVTADGIAYVARAFASGEFCRLTFQNNTRMNCLGKQILHTAINCRRT